MNILILSAYHPYKTAGVVALDLFEGLKNIEGNEVKLIVRKWDKYPDKNIIPLKLISFHLLKGLERKLSPFLNKIGLRKIKPSKSQKSDPGYCVLENDLTITYHSTKSILKKAGFKPDVIVVLFMEDFLSFKNLYELNSITNAPIILHMMDMAAITGGCHYAWDCIGYTKKCGNCPALFSKDENDQSSINFQFKKQYIDKTNIIPISGTDWQYNQLCKSNLFKEKRKIKILLPIDENKYCPSDKIKVRQELGLPLDKKIIFFGAISVTDRRKGFNELIEAFKILSKNVNDPSLIHLAIAGNNSANFKDILPFSSTVLGYLNHDTLPKAFQAADIFVCPSVEDSGPMMVNQSIMSGTPVVAFEMGVALDLVHNGETGYRAKLRDSAEFAQGLKHILELDETAYNQMSHNCRELGLKLCEKEQQHKKFMEILKEVVENRN